MPPNLRPERVSVRPAALLAALAALAGCSAGSGEGLDISGRPVEEGGNIPLAPTLPAIQANVFDPYCVVCHSGANAPLGLRLDSSSSYTSLVSVRSRETASFLVDPGNPDLSYLVRKLEGNAAQGGRMPLGGPPLPQSTIAFVRQWIAEGALPEGGPPAAGPPVVVTLSPLPDATLANLPAEITVGFDQDIDASTVNAQTFLLVRSGGDGTFGNGDDVAVTPASIGLSTTNARLAVMDLSGVPSVDDRYRVTLEGSGPSIVLSVGGRALDGELTGGLPSGDGIEGGDFIAEFDVAGLQPSLDSIQANVFTPACAVCHTGPAGPVLPAGLDLSSAGASFASLVGVASLQVPSLDRVAPADADQSYLVQKLEGTAAIGTQMPQGGPFLDPASIEVIRQWINGGAMR